MSLKCVASMAIGGITGGFIRDFCDMSNASDVMRLGMCVVGTVMITPGLIGVEKLIDKAFEPELLEAYREEFIREL